jgi:hypothetical protein
MFLEEPDEEYVEQENRRQIQGRELTPLGVAWVAGCQLCRLLYVNDICNLQDYLKHLCAARDRLMAALFALNPSILRRKGKLHLLYHLPTCKEMFGPLRSYMTEMHERQNGEIRARIQQTSKHNPSKDVHKHYGSEGLFAYSVTDTTTSIVRLRGQTLVESLGQTQTSSQHLMHKVKNFAGFTADRPERFRVQI